MPSRRQINSLCNQIQVLKAENIDLRSKLEKSLQDKEDKIKHYESQIKASKSQEKNFETKLKELFLKQFSQNQSDIIMKKKKIVRWTTKELSHAFSLRYFSKRSYIYLRKILGYPLPGISTLQRWASSINMTKGLLPEILSFMKVMGE